MAIQPYSPRIFIGLSTDAKPTTNLTADYIFLETDTLAVYFWNGVLWRQMT